MSQKFINRALICCTAAMLLCAALLSFTVSDYYIFSRFAEFGFFFCLSQWMKKAGIILITLAVFFKCRSCADSVKYTLPLFIILSCCLFGNFFNATPQIDEGPFSTNLEIFAKVNSGFPKWLNVTLFFVQNAAMLSCCALLFLRDGYKVPARSFIALPLSMLAAMPLNIFENTFDLNKVPADSFFRFKNFSLWHFLAIIMLICITEALYRLLKDKPREVQDKYLAALSVTLLLQYHCKDSLLLSDGYNVYKTIFSALPLFICNIGVYVACASVFLKKRVLYAIAFFIHAIGALTVFIYFGKDGMSNYGIVISYSFVYFCFTHCILFTLCVLPSALGHYQFRIKDCIIPLIYYFIVIIVSSIASTLISDASTRWVANDGVTHLIYDGVYVQGSFEGASAEMGSPGYMKPNFAFTQTNPLPFDVPNVLPMGGAFAYINSLYVFLVYLAYVCLFFGFYALYLAFVYARRRISIYLQNKFAYKKSKPPLEEELTVNETAVAKYSDDENKKDA